VSELDRYITNMQRIRKHPPVGTIVTQIDIQEIAEALEFLLKQKR